MTDAIRQNTVLGWNLAFSAGACAAGWALVSPLFAGSLALGAALEVMNFRAMFGFSERALLGRGNGSQDLDFNLDGPLDSGDLILLLEAEAGL